MKVQLSGSWVLWSYHNENDVTGLEDEENVGS